MTFIGRARGPDLVLGCCRLLASRGARAKILGFTRLTPRGALSRLPMGLPAAAIGSTRVIWLRSKYGARKRAIHTPIVVASDSDRIIND